MFIFQHTVFGCYPYNMFIFQHTVFGCYPYNNYPYIYQTKGLRELQKKSGWRTPRQGPLINFF